MPRRVLPALALGLLIALSAPVAAQTPFDDPVLERMRKDVFFLASPECEGRGIDTKGIDKAADYVADAFKKAGLKPRAKIRSMATIGDASTCAGGSSNIVRAAYQDGEQEGYGGPTGEPGQGWDFWLWATFGVVTIGVTAVALNDANDPSSP